jgi:hypothetical protein
MEDPAMASDPRFSRDREHIVGWENIADFNLFSNTMLAKLAPVGYLETFFAERIVSLAWRIKRATYMQKATLEYLKAVEAAKIQAKAGESSAGADHPQKGPATRDDDDAVLVQIMSDPANVKILERLLKYEQRFHDRLRRTTKELLKLQRLRERETGTESSEDPMADWPTPDQFPDLPPAD